LQKHFVTEGSTTMMIRFFRSDAGRSGEWSDQPNGQRRQHAFGHALTGIALGLISLCAQGATDPSIVPARLSLSPAPLSVSPARIDLSDKTPRVTVTVHNDDNRMAMFVVMQPMVWTKDGIAPHYELTPDVIAKPATLLVAPGATQTVGVELRSPTGTLRGRDFQLFWQGQAELPNETYKSNDRAAP
jgi:P pilus assembly chaperone PapD